METRVKHIAEAGVRVLSARLGWLENRRWGFDRSPPSALPAAALVLCVPAAASNPKEGANGGEREWLDQGP
jgi:hypothetical protein